MYDTSPQPYVLLGHVDGDVLVWRVARSSDMALCGMELGHATDDGVLVSHPCIREWTNADAAMRYILHLESGEAQHEADFPVVWVPPADFFVLPPERIVDGPL